MIGSPVIAPYKALCEDCFRNLEYWPNNKVKLEAVTLILWATLNLKRVRVKRR